MGQRNNSQKRRQARTHQARLDAKTRRAERARQQRPVRQRPLTSERILANNGALSTEIIDPTLLTVDEELRKLLCGEGIVSILRQAWIPISEDHPFIEVTADISMLGSTTRIRGSIDPSALAPEAPEEGTQEYWLWQIASAARLVLAALLQDQIACQKLVIKWGIEHVLDDITPGVAEVVLQRLDLPRSEEKFLDPFAKRLPASERDFWNQVSSEGLWFENVGEFLFNSIQVDVEGPLVDVTEVLDHESYHWLAARVRQHDLG